MKPEESLNDARPSTDEIGKALHAVVNTATPHERARLLREHSKILLNDQAIELLDKNTKSATEKGDEYAVAILQSVRYRIELARRLGLEVAIASLELQPFLDASSWSERKEILERNSEVLLSEHSNRALEELLEINSASPSAVSLINAASAYLTFARQNGLQAAKSWLLNGMLGTLSRSVDEPQESLTLSIEDIQKVAGPEEWLEANSQIVALFAHRVQDLDFSKWLIQTMREELKSAPSPLDRAKFDFSLGMFFLESDHQELIDESINFLREALETFETSGLRVHGLYGTLGRAHMRRKTEDQSNFITARDYLQRELDTVDRTQDPDNWTTTNRLLGAVYLSLEDRENAIRHFAASMEIEPEGKDDLYAQAGLDLARLRLEEQGPARLSAIEQGIVELERAANKATDNSPLWARIQSVLGQIYRERKSGDPKKNFELALDHTKQALQGFTRKQFPNEWAETQHNLGTQYYSALSGESSDNIERAIFHYNQALTVHTREAYPQSHGLTCSALGLALVEREAGEREQNLDQALHLFREAEASIQPIDSTSKTWLAEAWTGIGVVLRERASNDEKNNLTNAAEYLEKAREAYRALGNKEREQVSASNLAAIYSQMSEFDVAAAPKAIQLAQEALIGVDKTTDPYYWARYNLNLGAAIFNKSSLSEKDVIEILTCLSNALEVFKPDQYPTYYLRTQNYAGHVHFLTKSWQQALQAYSAVIAAGEESLDAAYTEPARRALVKQTELAHVRSAYCLIKLRRFDEALITIEAGKTRLLRESLSSGEVVAANVPMELVERLRNGRDLVRALEGRMRQSVSSRSLNVSDIGQRLLHARTDLQSIADEIRKYTPDFGESIDDISELLELIPEKGALVAFVLTSYDGFAIVVEAGAKTIKSKHIVPLPDLTPEKIHRIVNIWTNLIETGTTLETRADTLLWLDAIKDSVNQMWRFTEPLYDKLIDLGVKPQSTLLILPQGGLWLLPLYAASREVDTKPRALADDYVVIQTPSMYVRKLCLLKKAQRTAIQPELLAVVDPSGSLQFAAEEVSTIARHFSQPTVLDDNSATVQSVLTKSKSATYLHFACHGQHNWSDPMKSGLNLAGQDLLLSNILAELDISLNCLVVLSACETGIPDLGGAAEEFLGLPTGFLLAGATGVICSLWKVHDAATYLLMTKFYELHMKQKISPHEALHKSQQWLRSLTVADLNKLDLAGGSLLDLLSADVTNAGPNEQICDNPFVWAGFIFVGA